VLCVVGRGLCDGLIRSEESCRLWRVVVCDHETSQAMRLKPARGRCKIQPPTGVVAPREKKLNLSLAIGIVAFLYMLLAGVTNSFRSFFLSFLFVRCLLAS